MLRLRIGERVARTALVFQQRFGQVSASLKPAVALWDVNNKPPFAGQVVPSHIG
jgi:hypothetical protein